MVWLINAIFVNYNDWAPPLVCLPTVYLTSSHVTKPPGLSPPFCILLANKNLKSGTRLHTDLSLMGAWNLFWLCMAWLRYCGFEQRSWLWLSSTLDACYHSSTSVWLWDAVVCVTTAGFMGGCRWIVPTVQCVSQFLCWCQNEARWTEGEDVYPSLTILFTVCLSASC